MQKKIGKNVYLLGFLSLFNDLTSDLIAPLLPAYVTSLGGGAVLLGVMEGCANALAYGTVLFSGYYADRFRDSKRLTLLGYRICAVVRILMVFPLLPLILAARWIDRIGKGIRTAPRDKLITSSVEKTEWGKAFGIQRAMDHTGSLLAPLLATALMGWLGQNYSKVFLIACIPSLLAVFVIPYFLKKVDFQELEGVILDVKPRLSWSRLNPSLKKYVGIIFVSSLSTPSELFLILRMEDLGLAKSQAPMVWFVLVLSALVASYFGGLSADRWGKRQTIMLGWFLFTLVYIGFAFSRWVPVLWVLISLYGIHMGLIESSERVVAASLVSAEQRASAMGWYYFAYGMGSLPASLLFGFFWSHVSYSFAFLWNAGLTVLAIVLFLILLNPKTRLHEH